MQLQAAPSGGLTIYIGTWGMPTETLIRALVIILITLVLASRVRHWFERATSRTRADAGTRLLVGRLLSILVLIVGAATLLDTFGIPLSAVVTFVGVIGLAISLALQDILKNFFAGLYLLFERPFRLGDVVVVRDECGVVETIGIRTTTLRTEENVEVVIPNMTIFAEVISNRTQFRPKSAGTDAKGAACSRPARPAPAQPEPERLGEQGSAGRSR
jgi:small conductance mechanosensitive channel